MASDRGQEGLSLQLRGLIAAHRLFVKPAVARTREPRDLREMFERGARRAFRLPAYACLTETALAPGLVALRISVRPGTRPPRPRKLLLYFHGGAFLAGSPHTHAAMLARLSRASRTEVIAPFWRLAPEHPFPAGPDDARAAFAALCARGYRAQDIVLGGDSAGGNIALGLLARLLAEGVRPAGLMAFAPAADLTFSSASMRDNATRDAALPVSQAWQIGLHYLGATAADDPRASPLFAEFADPPPVFLQVAETEILRDDVLRLAEKLRAAGGAVTLDLWPDAPHVFVLFTRWAPEAREALGRAAGFVNALFEPQTSAGDSASR